MLKETVIKAAFNLYCMEDNLKNWIIALLVIQIVLMGYVGYGSKYIYDRFNNLQENFNSFKLETNKNLQEVNNKLGSVEQDFKNSASNLSSSIQKLEVTDKKLEKGLKDVQIKSQDFSGIIEETLESVVSLQTNKGLGSGVIVAKEGYLATNYHVVEGINAAVAITYKKGNFPIRLIKVDPRLDLALIKIDGEFRPLDFADSDLVKVGDKVIALGNPNGLSFTVTEGIVSQINRELNGVPYNLLQTDVSINPGNSGGPLVNIQGQIVGINRLKIKDFEGLGFAIPADIVKKFVSIGIKEDKELLDKIEQQNS